MDELDPRFKIHAALRCDGIGRLDCAEDLESGMRMAVRWLPLEANGCAAVEACERLPDHPTLPRIRQIGQMGASAYVAMDFPDGDLLPTQAGASLTGPALIGITAQLADALATIHSQEVFHGELSADSVLLVRTPSERAFLWDMPLVIANRLTDRRGEERLMTQLVRTAPYLAPERARGGEVTAAADVYSLGAIVCVAGGTLLPKAATTLGVIHAVVSASWVPRVPKSIPEPLRSMLARMISREPRERPTAREVAELFLPPVAARPTLPELAVVVLPPSTPALLAGRDLDQPVDPRLTRATEPPLPMITAPMPAPLEVRVLDTHVPSAPVAPMVLREKPADVVLTDSVIVSQEMRLAGAALLSAEEAAKLTLPNRKVPLVMAGVMAVLVTVLLAMAIDLAHQAPLTKTAASPSSAASPVETRAAAPVAAPTALERDTVEAEPVARNTPEEDLLSPLTPRAKRAAKKRILSPPVEQLAVPEAEASTQDADLLQEEQELKRPRL